MEVVEISSSDDEDTATTINQKLECENALQAKQRSIKEIAMPISGNRTAGRKSFWKAGDWDSDNTISLVPVSGQLEHARVHPKFLHSNASSHKWVLGAIAELLDNAVDEIQNGATFVKVDKVNISKDNSPALIFEDDGGGMDPVAIRKCMSLGYSSKKSKTTIGQYGNGFKTSTMRLGADVIVFSRATQLSKKTQSIGLLSYTFLRRTGQDDVIVPMIDFDISGNWSEPIIYSSLDDWSSNLKVILEWSPFSSRAELIRQFENIGPHGTRILIYNLWLNDEGLYELNFDDDDEDIRLRDEANCRKRETHLKMCENQNHISYAYHFSLRAYASILYLRKFTDFKIILRGVPLKQYNIADDLKFPKTMTYRPQLGLNSKEVSVEVTIGFIKDAPVSISGYNVYHRNRLIRPFWKVTVDGSSVGNGVVGLLEANFIEPAHDKQGFERSSLFTRLESKLKQMTAEFWRRNRHLIADPPLSFELHNVNSQTADEKTQHFPTAHEIARVPNFLNDGNASLPGEHSFVDLEAKSCNEAPLKDHPRSKLIEQIREENIQLFMRCEERAHDEKELQKMIEGLEKELVQAKRKSYQLSLHLETKKKRMLGNKDGHVS